MISEPYDVDHEIEKYIQCRLALSDLNYELTLEASQPYIKQICERWLPDGYEEDGFWFLKAYNDEHFVVVQLDTGRWAYWNILRQRMTGMTDIISLSEFLFGDDVGDAINRTANAAAKIIRTAN